VANAESGSIQTAFRKALIPHYGGGRTCRKLGDTLERVLRDIDDPERSELLACIEILSPTQESFTDYQSPAAREAFNEATARTARRDNRSAPDPIMRITYGITEAKQMPMAGRGSTPGP
jgi:hypothetical protein